MDASSMLKPRVGLTILHTLHTLHTYILYLVNTSTRRKHEKYVEKYSLKHWEFFLKTLFYEAKLGHPE